MTKVNSYRDFKATSEKPFSTLKSALNGSIEVNCSELVVLIECRCNIDASTVMNTVVLCFTFLFFLLLSLTLLHSHSDSQSLTHSHFLTLPRFDSKSLIHTQSTALAFWRNLSLLLNTASVESNTSHFPPYSKSFFAFQISFNYFVPCSDAESNSKGYETFH